MVKRALCAAGLALLFAVPASAQLPPPPGQEPPPPEEQQPPPKQPPPVTPAADPGTDWVSEGADASHRYWNRTEVRPPYELQWVAKIDGLTPKVMLASGGVVVTLVGEDSSAAVVRMIALDAATGARLWTSEARFDDIAIAAGRVVASVDRTLQGLDLRTGRKDWETPVGYAFDLTAAGDDVVFYASDVNAKQAIVVLNAATGEIRMRNEATWSSNLGRLMVSGDRIFHSDSCSAAAYDRRDGARLWGVAHGCSGGSQDGFALSGDKVYGRGVFSAASGERLPDPAATGTVIAGDRVITNTTGPDLVMRALELSTGRELWRTGSLGASGEPYGAAIAAGDQVFLRRAGGLVVLDRLTGAELFSAYLKGRNAGAMIAAGGQLLIGDTGGTITALGPQRDRPFVVGIEPAAPVVEYGGSVKLTSEAHYGEDLYVRTPFVLHADESPVSGLVPAATAKPDEYGKATFSVKPAFNTAYRVAAHGGSSKTVIATVLPRIRVKRLSATRTTVRLRLDVRVPARVKLRGRRIGVYLSRVSARRYDRLAVGRLRGGGGRFSTTVRSKTATVRGRNFIAFCVTGLSRQGLGYGDRLDRRCGGRRISSR